MTTLTLIRFLKHSDGVISRLLSVDKEQLAVCLEHAYGDHESGWSPKLPNGTYTCTRYLSPKRGYKVWLVNNVPGAEYIEIHPGNFNEDSEGCILPGDALAYDGERAMVTHSKAKFSELEALLGEEPFTLVVEG